ncbi:MAG: PilZ domain-containing protein [Myxococcota bacterium]
MERRRSPRFRTRFDALISADKEGAGTLAEISYAGARLDESSVQPPIGTRVRLYLFVQPIAPFELEGVVTRHTDGGFALTYELFDPEVRRLVDDVAALVTERARA